MSESFKGDHQVRVAVLTISDTRTKETDTGGQLVQRLARNEGLELVGYDVVEDDIASIRVSLSEWLENEEVDVIITTGGTGIAKRDVTLEAVKPFFEKEIDGFGELFRYVSFLEDIGTKALLSRAAAGIANDKAIFVLPGSRGAVKLAMERLILPEIQHIRSELTKHQQLDR
ncbi:MogA/MoaB family molybdenum cofactor biosynthesis protein [Microbacterium sp. APC 3898]|uniref:Molybdenum cofactor biosynthesis protein B n=1 Tax=Planococcus notacanthi TaxID=3035188 RepID=A0ABT7ZK50_9BACL|nr:MULTISPECIES: MogA/MoaB family molybdenum cofactor biosynthesis protein [Terrabacteria group]MDN3427496.1 MogA/MoaB family molybdenum cofactor biosynthesis protein [Planococcus sp. APC 4016]MDN3499047.1 MogA/MoaB family molybdenum cofactor biosynthesis protein [Microbacterium sp. APC 3898]